MAIDFGALPPEVNSARVYAGAGSAPLMTAASAWNAVAAELSAAALAYDKVVTQLAGEEWLGPASASMAAAVAPYVEWIRVTAETAEQAATQASAAAAAYEAAFAATVPPPLISANRVELARLVSTNVIGQNTGAIAHVEGQYAEFWAQDAATMYSYANAAAVASSVTPFAAAPQVTSPAGSTAQSAAVTAAAGVSTGSAHSEITHLMSQITGQLQNLAAPVRAEYASLASSSGPLSGLWQTVFGSPSFPGSSLSALMSAYSPFAGVFYNTEGMAYFGIGMGNFMTQTAKTLGAIAPAAPAAAAAVPKGLPGLGGLAAGAPAHAAGSLGTASAVGRLSVPPGWTEALAGAHAPTSTGSAIPVSNIREAPDVSSPPGAGNLLGGMPLAGAGRGAAGSGPRYGFRPTVMTRPPSAG